MRPSSAAWICLLLRIANYTCYAYHVGRRDLYIGRVPHRMTKLNYENGKPQIDDGVVNYFKRIREEFPFFKRENCPAYFDSAATTQKPACVIRKLTQFYSSENANVHRGIYKMSLDATNSYEQVRKTIKNYINCEREDEIIFTSGTTHGLNLICNMVMDRVIQRRKDEIYLTYLEHHSNIVPWQEQIKKKKKGKIKYIPLKSTGYINIKKLRKKINKNTKIISISHVSNVLGNVQKLSAIIRAVREVKKNIIVIVDAAQSFAHIRYDLKRMEANNCCPDVLIASGHKFCAALGCGFIYLKNTLTRSYKFKPLLYGSNMITTVGKYESEFASSPHLFESGTQNIAGVISMGVAIDFLEKIDQRLLYRYEMYLYDILVYYLGQHLQQGLVQLPGGGAISGSDGSSGSTQSSGVAAGTSRENDQCRLYIHNSRKGKGKKVPILPLWSDQFTSFDLVTFLDFKNVCVRSGHHCASLLLKEFLRIPDCARASLFFYNTPEEVQYLAEQIASVARMLSGMKKWEVR
ncbi:cysteine desulfurase [Plasmodium cynomolgi strain B]|uniref:Cysteine desulfurase n=1 Tax=Plasmodium cynomolgi (strain B) TaxID=1120755 RepID=K6US71_PLACD|nr:cysteine desulfurase [Plasmodium cynomolgi strain B]GAB64790.1 cysteine desulfurase [Plasmodium cynomolgi strain B]